MVSENDGHDGEFSGHHQGQQGSAAGHRHILRCFLSIDSRAL